MKGFGIVHPLTDDLETAEHVVRRLLSALMAVRLDASSADLSGLELGMGDLGALEGVIWTETTRWPVALFEIIQGNSERIGDGVYQISPRADRDDANIDIHK